jgi:hypothetical protein
MSDDLCNEVCGVAKCTDTCNRPKGHNGEYHVTADDVCAWNNDRTWFGPADSKNMRDGDE